MTTTHLVPCAALLLLAACRAGPEARVPRDSVSVVTTSPGATASEPAAPGPWSPPAPLERSATRDLTGDGAPERLVLRATGPRIDSLTIVLEIRDGKSGALLHGARWTSRDYFKYLPAVGRSDSAARDALVRRRLERVLNDSAFVAPRTRLPGGRSETVDTATVRYALRELDWRRAHGITDSMSTPRQAETELGRQTTTSPALRARTEAVAAELQGRPTFTLFQGGELTSTIAWSDREHAFIRVFSCC